MANDPLYNRFTISRFDSEASFGIVSRWNIRNSSSASFGFIRLHVLHHAAEGDLYGHWMIEELARHGYRVSPGTLYPMLHAMERKGYLESRTERAGRSHRRLYRATPYGVEALKMVHDKIRELFHEVVPGGADH